MRTQSFHAGNIMSALYALANTITYNIRTDTSANCYINNEGLEWYLYKVTKFGTEITSTEPVN
jgi:hypothetical protein